MDVFGICTTFPWLFFFFGSLSRLDFQHPFKGLQNCHPGEKHLWPRRCCRSLDASYLATDLPWYAAEAARQPLDFKKLSRFLVLEDPVGFWDKKSTIKVARSGVKTINTPNSKPKIFEKTGCFNHISRPVAEVEVESFWSTRSDSAPLWWSGV